mgnify:CR=1 FL=1
MPSSPGQHLSRNGRIVLGAPAARYDDAATLKLQPAVDAGARRCCHSSQDLERQREAFLRDAIAWFAEGHIRLSRRHHRWFAQCAGRALQAGAWRGDSARP